MLRPLRPEQTTHGLDRPDQRQRQRRRHQHENGGVERRPLSRRAVQDRETLDRLERRRGARQRLRGRRVDAPQNRCAGARSLPILREWLAEDRHFST